MEAMAEITFRTGKITFKRAKPARFSTVGRTDKHQFGFLLWEAFVQKNLIVFLEKFLPSNQFRKTVVDT